MDRHDDVSPWFAHPVYARYWHHYRQALAWQQRHRRAYTKALEAFYGPPPPSRYSDWHGGKGMACPSRGRAQAEGPRGQAACIEGSGSSSERDAEESESDDDIECDVSNMEITEELRQYFAQTERHREELKKQQQMEAEQQGPYVLADHDLRRVPERSVRPPVERPGERRGVEMRKLYGDDAAKIQGMETAMQLTFDRNCDRKQPKYWPVIPLRL